MNSYKLSTLNPIRFHQDGVGDFFFNQIPSHEFQRGYNQVYVHGDRPYLQIFSSTAAAVMTMTLIGNNGTVYKTWNLGSPQATLYGTWYVYNFIYYFPFTTSTPAVLDGIYFLHLNIVDVDGVLDFYSEPINLITDDSNTLKIQYTHDQNDFDTLFIGDFTSTFLLRVEGGLKSDGFAPGGKFTMFQDLDYNSVLLQSQPFNVEKYIFGPSTGIPNYMADKINRIFGLSTVTINSIGYSRNEGAKIERNGETDYPLAGWSLDLIRTANEYSEDFTVHFVEQDFLASNDIILASNDTLLASQETYQQTS